LISLYGIGGNCSGSRVACNSGEKQPYNRGSLEIQNGPIPGNAEPEQSNVAASTNQRSKGKYRRDDAPNGWHTNRFPAACGQGRWESLALTLSASHF
jgi:hypothetical protein